MSVVDEKRPSGARGCRSPATPKSTSSSRRSSKYERGEITPDQWRVYRLVRGTYGQRQAEDAQMLRVKIPQGLLTADHLEVLAEIGERYSRGFGHITTRQNIQFHFVKLHDVEPAMRLLAEAGVTTREACGNSVRNITGMPVCRRLGRRTLRRDAVRRGADAVPAAASAQLRPSAQVQDRVRRLPDRSRRHGHQRSRVPRRDRAGRRPRASASRRVAARPFCARRPRSCTSSCRRPRFSGSPRPCCACFIASATTSTSSGIA